MKILVPTKRVPDIDQKIRASADGSRIETDHLPFVINPFDAIALEEAITLSENLGEEVEVISVGIGCELYEEQLRSALAMGAGRALRVECGDLLDPWNAASILAAVVKQEQPDLVLMGKQAIDDDANQTGQFLAAMLDWPQATFASKIEIEGGRLLATREVDDGLETISAPLPCVVTVDLRLNEPRYASLAGIMKAKKKTIEVTDLNSLGVSVEARVEVISHRSEETERHCQMLASADELVELLGAS
ncbi:MAG: electron transfer flavoprotein subunit beta/FixA family protein [Aeoliella sp.]